MRSRNIKPGFFDDEKLLKCSFGARLLFAGLWCFSDREGRFEWKPSQIRISIFPDQPEVDVITLLGELLNHGLTCKYIVDEQTYGYLIHFKEHQRPHPHEAKSKIPPFSKENQCHDISPLHYTAECPSDSLILKPSDCFKRVGAEAPSSLPTKEDITEGSLPKIKDDLEDLTEKLYREKIFPDAPKFKNQMLKQGKNPRAIIHAFVRCYIKKPAKDQAWGYCTEIIKDEDGNYNEKDSTRSY